ncbi:MAG: SRPBCC family protein [Anaerolineales bacterium]
MKQDTFDKEIFIHSDVKTVVDLLSDYSQHHKIHPLIEKVERATAEPAGVLKRYFITDNLKWGPFKFKIQYRADIMSITEDSIYTEAYQSPGTYINNLTKVSPTDNGILLHETVTLKAPNLLFGYAFQQAQIAHEEMFKRIKAFIER